MTILIDIFLGNHAMVFDDLLQIVRCDPGLTTSQPTPYVLQLAFQQKQQSVASSSRVLSLANNATTILVAGVSSTFITPDGRPITAFSAVVMPGTLTEPITVWIDVTNAAGQGYYVFDTNGATIEMPRQVTLYHELAHAFHMILGDEPATAQAKEVQAIHDENTLRAQLFMALRHPTNHNGGVGPPSHGGVDGFPRCKPVDPGFNWDCIVASAAVGTPYAPRVDELRRARREYRSLSLWATLISEPVLELYRKFSPGVVREMNTDPALRQAMLLYAVQPVFHLVQIAESYLRAEADDPELMAVIDRSVDEYVADLSKAGVSLRTIADAAEGAAIAARTLGPDRTAAAAPGRGEMPGDLHAYLAAAIASQGNETAGYAWAFEGIALFLGQAVARGVYQRGITPTFLDALGTWLARLPIPTETLLSIADARDELKVFAERVFTRAHPRAQFAHHLLARWPAASVPALRSLLNELHYLRTDHDTPN